MKGRLFSLYARQYGLHHMNRLHPVDGALNGGSIDLAAAKDNTDLLYIHIPYCESLCPYCTFHRIQYDARSAAAYFQALQQELTLYHWLGYQFTALYIGGGTPTVNSKLLKKLVLFARKLFPIDQLSVETNPNFLTNDNVLFLKDLGVNRLSVGVQSLQNDLLDQMGRLNPYGDKARILAHLSRAIPEFDTVNIDMIFNLPGQTEAQLLSDLDTINNLRPTQVSWYPLMPSRQSAKAMSKSMGTFSFTQEHAFYRLIDDAMAVQYQAGSAWCFNLKDHPSAIDEYVVTHENYVGVGSGAFGYQNGQLMATSFSIDDYIERVNSGHSGITQMQRMSHTEVLRYQLLMQLFSLKVPHRFWLERYQLLPDQLLGRELKILRWMGAIDIDQDGIRLTQYGRYVWVVLMREFFMGVNQYRSTMRQLVNPAVQ